MKKANIQQIEPEFAQKLDLPWKSILQELNYSVPSGYRVRVSLRDAKRRKKPSNVASDNWSPLSSDRAEIWLEPCPPERATPPAEIPSRPRALSVPVRAGGAAIPGETSQNAQVRPAEADLLRALDRAESTPGWSFVSLKKFRDEILPAANVPSVRSDVERQSVLSSAIEKRLILTKPVPNPKSPQFPVMSIRLNRMMPEVQEVLGQPKKNLDFRPIRIKGEPLSATILRERR